MIEYAWQLLQEFLDFVGDKFSWRDAIDIGLVTFAIYYLLLLSTAAVTKPRIESGAATCKNASSGLAPRLAAASMGARPTAAKAVSSGCTMKGREYSTEATTRPAKEKVRASPVSCTHRPPRVEVGLKNTRR